MWYYVYNPENECYLRFTDRKEIEPEWTKDNHKARRFGSVKAASAAAERLESDLMVVDGDGYEVGGAL